MSPNDPNETWAPWKEGCSTLPGRAGISKAFRAAYGSRAAPVDVDQCRHSGIGALADGSSNQQRFDMSAIIKSEMISRRKALSLMGLAAAFGLAAAPTVLTVSDAEAQTAAAPTAARLRPLRLRPLAWSGVRSGVRVGTSDVRSGVRVGTSGVRCGAQVQLPAQGQVQLPAQLSNSTGTAKSLIEPIARNGGRRPLLRLERYTAEHVVSAQRTVVVAAHHPWSVSMSKRKPASKHARSPKIAAKAHRAKQAIVRSPKASRAASSTESPPERHND